MNTILFHVRFRQNCLFETYTKKNSEEKSGLHQPIPGNPRGSAYLLYVEIKAAL